jgi:sec-independent protein translocase protein TatB
MLRTMGLWVQKLRKLTTEVRAQTGIDEILREEGIDGVQGLRSLLRGEIAAAKQRGRRDPADDPYAETLEFDLGREHPVEGPDAYHAVPEDLLDADEPTRARPWTTSPIRP